MLQQIPDVDTVRAVLSRACRAPTLSNSQPWRWRWDGAALDLFVDADRLLLATDAFDRQHSAAIDRRYTDRAPLAATEAWAEPELALRNLCLRHNSHRGTGAVLEVAPPHR